MSAVVAKHAKHTRTRHLDRYEAYCVLTLRMVIEVSKSRFSFSRFVLFYFRNLDTLRQVELHALPARTMSMMTKTMMLSSLRIQMSRQAGRWCVVVVIWSSKR